MFDIALWLVSSVYFRYSKINSDSVKEPETEAALDLLANWHPLLPAPVVLITICQLQKSVEKITEKDILFNTILIDNLEPEEFKIKLQSTLKQLLPRTKCLPFIIQLSNRKTKQPWLQKIIGPQALFTLGKGLRIKVFDVFRGYVASSFEEIGPKYQTSSCKLVAILCRMY